MIRLVLVTAAVATVLCVTDMGDTSYAQAQSMVNPNDSSDPFAPPGGPFAPPGGPSLPSDNTNTSDSQGADDSTETSTPSDTTDDSTSSDSDDTAGDSVDDSASTGEDSSSTGEDWSSNNGYVQPPTVDEAVRTQKANDIAEDLTCYVACSVSVRPDGGVKVELTHTTSDGDEVLAKVEQEQSTVEIEIVVNNETVADTKKDFQTEEEAEAAVLNATKNLSDTLRISESSWGTFLKNNQGNVMGIEDFSGIFLAQEDFTMRLD